MLRTPVILVAEDDENVSIAMESILTRKFTCDVVVVKNGQEAWEKIQSCSIDLIISDWNMPYKSGDQLLMDVRKHERARYTPFIMLTARSDKQSVVTAVQSGVSNYISKPFRKNDVVDKVRQYISDGSNPDFEAQINSLSKNLYDHSSLERDLKNAVDRCLNDPGFVVPVLPDIAQDVIYTINEGNSNAEKLAQLINPDAGLTSKLIAISNSIYFRGNQIINNLPDAIVRLGFKETENYVMMYSQKGMLNTSNEMIRQLLNRFWQHSYATALSSRYIAKFLKLPGAENYFTIGLLHDIGKLLLMKILLDFIKQGACYDEQTVLNVLSANHEKCGGFLLKKWGFGIEFIEAATNHHMIRPTGQESTAVLVANLADMISRKIGYSMDDDIHIDLDDMYSAKTLMIGKKDINTIIVSVDDEISKLIVSI